MKFIPELFTRCSARLGTLSELERIPDVVLETPLLMLYTKRGSIPHVTREVLEMITPEKLLLTMSLPTTFDMADPVRQFKSIADFVGLKEYPAFLTIEDPAQATVSGYNDEDTIAVWTRHGKQIINADRYMDIVEAFRPDFYLALYDGDTHSGSSSKRIAKSVDRSRIMLDKCLARHTVSEVLRNKGILGAVGGGYNTTARELSIKNLEGKNLAGYVIDGLHNNGPETEKIPFQSVEDIVKHTISLLPQDKMRVSMGAWNPVTVMNLIKLGVDLFDSSYPYLVTERSCALTFLYHHSESGESPMISISEKRYADDFTPICKDCKCLTCLNHTKAYLHHLYQTKELLGAVLLMIHNIHHYLEYFKEIRNSLRNGTFRELETKIYVIFAKNDPAN
ncbi:queuine tRNA-ribosyltransferase accessory subunit 2 [Diprion similis]|uniref:queuine tRNA-ribosyltransferase accessory subunit 2 n=1 Tax=Diprion similis TaxID=362088 RepID=UPI001EF7C918|nr:queuine tRNA-ribosyltransferase accessory subunit 2 [Diprion similis]